MKRFSILVMIVVLISGLILAGCAGAPSAAKTFDLKMAYSMPAQAGLHTEYFLPWSKIIEEQTGGRVKITTYPGETLVSLEDEYDALVSGMADIVRVEPDVTPGRFPLSEINLLPLLYPTGEIAARVYWETMEKYTFKSEWKDVKIILTAAIPPMNYHGTKPVQKMEDFKGLRIRTSGRVESWTVEALGGTPVEMGTGDLNQALERGLVDGIFFADTGVLAYGLANVTKARTFCHIFDRVWVVGMNLKTWNSLPADIKKIFEANTGPDVSARYTAAYEKQSAGAIAALTGIDKKSGNPGFYKLPDAELQRWEAAVKPVWDRWAASVEDKGRPANALLKDTLELVKKYSQ